MNGERERERERERRHMRPALIGPILRRREREREKPDGGMQLAESGNALFFYRSFYTLS